MVLTAPPNHSRADTAVETEGDIDEYFAHVLSFNWLAVGLTLRFSGGPRSGPSAATGCWAAFESRHSCTRLRSWALIATTTVLADISTAPTAGVRKTPHAASTPAARGMATMLYPAAHHRFWSILR